MITTSAATPLSRRGFLLVLGAAGSALFTTPAMAALGPATPAAHPRISAAMLKAELGTQFVLQTPAGRIKARLDKVDEGKSNSQLQQFSAHFSLPESSDQVLPQQLYSLESAALGKLDLFMLPGNDGPTRSLVASFCHLVSA